MNLLCKAQGICPFFYLQLDKDTRRKVKDETL